jgi:hypothetical protein
VELPGQQGASGWSPAAYGSEDKRPRPGNRPRPGFPSATGRPGERPRFPHSVFGLGGGPSAHTNSNGQTSGGGGGSNKDGGTGRGGSNDAIPGETHGTISDSETSDTGTSDAGTSDAGISGAGRRPNKQTSGGRGGSKKDSRTGQGASNGAIGEESLDMISDGETSEAGNRNNRPTPHGDSVADRKKGPGGKGDMHDVDEEDDAESGSERDKKQGRNSGNANDYDDDDDDGNDHNAGPDEDRKHGRINPAASRGSAPGKAKMLCLWRYSFVFFLFWVN